MHEDEKKENRERKGRYFNIQNLKIMIMELLNGLETL